MERVVALDPIPGAPHPGRVRQLKGCDAEQLRPHLPIITKGALHVVRPVLFVDRRIAPIDALAQGITVLAQKHGHVWSAPCSQGLQFRHVAVNGQERVQCPAVMNVQLRRVVAGIGMRGPAIKGPATVRHGAEHLVDKSRRVNIAARRQRRVENHDARVASGHGTDRAGSLLQELAVLGRIRCAAPLQVQVRLVPDLQVEGIAVTSRQPGGHAGECLGHAGVVTGPVGPWLQPA